MLALDISTECHPLCPPHLIDLISNHFRALLTAAFHFCSGHASRVASLSWGSPSLLSSGSRDSMIHNHDVRADPHCVAVLQGHQQEVCGLKWSLQGTQLASGGNDNLLHVWEPRQNRPRLCIERHSAAVKALAWCPFQHNVLASGGGTADRKICLWNTGNGLCLNEVDTKSQVRDAARCNLGLRREHVG